MHRAVTVAVVLAVLAGSVPAAATLADGTPTSDSQPGASFAGVVGVQGAEVDNEVANRSLERQFEAARDNDSKASVVAAEGEQLQQRLEALEAEKERLQTAYENGTISKGKYKAQLAVVAADLRAVERRANRTAGVAERLPPEALRESGANASHIRDIAQQANRTGGGAVAEAARDVAGESVGNGLGGPPPHAGPPEDAGGPGGEGPPDGAGPPDNAGPGDEQSANGTATDTEGDGDENPAEDVGPPNGSNASNGSAGNGSTAGPPADAGPPNGSGNGPPEDAGRPGGTDNESGVNGSANGSRDAPGVGSGNGLPGGNNSSDGTDTDTRTDETPEDDSQEEETETANTAETTETDDTASLRLSESPAAERDSAATQNGVTPRMIG